MSPTSSNRKQDGVTLVELLVVMILLGVVGGIVTTAVATTLRSAASTQSRSIALNELETALQRVTRDLRMADPLRLSTQVTAANYNTVVGADGLGPFGNDLGATITRDGQNFIDVRYRLDGASVPQRLIREDTGQTLVTLVDNAGIPVFTYLDANGQELDCVGLDFADCQDRLASAVQIRVTLVRAIGDRRPVQADTVINVRSVRYGG